MDSPDIKVSATPTSTPGYTVEYTTNGQPSYVHAIVRNDGSQTAEGYLNLYWVKSSAAVTWNPSGGPNTWINSTGPGVSGTVPYGDQIGVPVPITVAATGSIEVVVPWFPPNPADFGTFSDPNHFCILARVVTGCGMTYPEISNTWYNVAYNNKIAQLNVAVYNNNPNDILGVPGSNHGPVAELIVANSNTATASVHLELDALTNGLGETIFDHANVYMYMQPSFYALWTSSGSSGYNITDLGGNVIQLNGNGAYLDKISMDPDSSYVIGMQYTFFDQADTTYNFEADLVETDANTTTLGGEHYIIVPHTCPGLALEGDSYTIDNGCCVDLTIHDPQAGVAYTWYDAGMSVVGTGTTVNVCPSSSTNYIAEAAQNGCAITHTISVTVTTVSCTGARYAAPSKTLTTKDPVVSTLQAIPNPAKDRASVRYSLPANVNAELLITNSYGEQIVRTIVSGEGRFDLDCAHMSTGVYYITLFPEGMPAQKTKLVVIR